MENCSICGKPHGRHGQAKYCLECFPLRRRKPSEANESNTDWRSKEFADLVPTEMDWARMAAYIDGEGSICINPRRSPARPDDPAGASTFYLKVTVANTDVRLLIWIKEHFGGSWKEANTQKYYEGRNAKNCYHWSAASGRAAWILRNCHQYFLIKQEQADIGIQLQESMNLFVRGTGGYKTLPDEVISKRRDLKRQLLVMKARGKEVRQDQLQRIEEVS